MRYWCFLFLILISCDREDLDGSQIPFKKRATVSKLDQVKMTLDVFPTQNSYTDPYPLYISLKEIESGQHLIPVDTALLSTFLRDNLYSNMKYPFGGSVLHFLSFYGGSMGGIKVLVSGDIKQTFPGDTIPGLPLVLREIEIIPTCSVPFTKTEEQVTLQNTTWNWRGFVNESNQVYSFPSCENPNVSIMLTENIVKDLTGYFYYLPPQDAMLFQLTGYYLNFFASDAIPAYEIKDSKLETHLAMLMPRFQGHISFPLYSTRFTSEKADSLSRMIRPTHFSEPEVVEFTLDGNQLVLYNPRLKIRALFTSD